MDRLPAPIEDGGVAPAVERASATSARAMTWKKLGTAAPLARRPSSASLAEVESRMIDAITGPEEAAAETALLVTPGPRLTARERLEIYRFGYRARLVECLDDDYPVLAMTLGQEGFERLATQYIDRFPSRSPNLNAFGRRMAELCLDADLGERAPHRAFLSELAALEWALVEAVHAKEPRPFDLTTLQAIPIDGWATARLHRSDTIRMLRFTHPVNAFYQSTRNDDAPPPIPGPRPSATAVYRSSYRLWRMDLTPAMARVLAALLEGIPIEESLSQMNVAEADPEALAEAERSVMVWFREWISCGFFGSLTLDPGAAS